MWFADRSSGIRAADIAFFPQMKLPSDSWRQGDSDKCIFRFLYPCMNPSFTAENNIMLL
jgi:hypothetical protein